MNKKNNIILCLIMVFVLFPSQFIFAQEKSLKLVAESKYFSIYASNHFDIAGFLYKLDFDYSTRPENLVYENSNSLPNILAKTIDALYLEVSDILDIHVYSYHGQLKVLKDRASVGSIFRNYYKTDMPERGFYSNNRKILYISEEDVTLGMLGHEIGHAVIGSYFVVPPPAKMQEVLCGYIEYNLRKKQGTLPEKRGSI